MIEAKNNTLTAAYLFTIIPAILIILWMAYYGIKNPDAILPEKCVLEFGLNCKSVEIQPESDRMKIVLQNNIGEDIMIHSIGISGEELAGCYADSGNRQFSESLNEKTGLHMQKDSEKKVVVHCSEIKPSKKKIKAELEIKWSNEDSHDLFTHTMRGEILASPENGEEYCCCGAENNSYNIWIKKSLCNEKSGKKCAQDEQGNYQTYHTCKTKQEKCCYDRKNNFYFWGDESCNNDINATVSDEMCEY